MEGKLVLVVVDPVLVGDGLAINPHVDAVDPLIAQAVAGGQDLGRQVGNEPGDITER